MNDVSSIVPGWNGTKRQDGLEIQVKEVEDKTYWEVAVPDGRPNLTTCFCCGRPFGSLRAAKLVANAVYPVSMRTNQ